MRRAALLLLASIVVPACGGEPLPPVAPVVTVPAPTAPPPPPPPPLPAEPAGLAPVVAPGGKVCELAGTLGSLGIELAAVAGGEAFGEVSHVPVALSFGEGGAAFVEARAPAWTLRGVASRESARVRAARWLSFGGVYYASANDRLRVDGARDGKVVLAAPDLSGFTLAGDATALLAPCDALSLDADANGVLRQGAPPAFATDRKEQAMLLSRRKPVAVSAEPGGPAGGTIDAAARPAKVTVLERRGARARVRWGHLAGWVDASLLSPPKPPLSRRLAIIEAAQFGMIGLLSSGPTPAAETPAVASDAGSTVVCAADVRILANVNGTAGAAPTRYVVGAIPAGKPLRVLDRGPEIAHLAVTDGFFAPGAVRLAVPARDVAAGCAPAPDVPAAAKGDRLTTADQASTDDAVDQLGGEGPEESVGSTLGEAFGAGGLGLSGVGEGAGGRGEGIGLGNLGHGAGTGTGQGFGRGSGSLGGARSTPAPSLREGAVAVNGRLPPEVIRRIVRQNFGRFRLCYENGLRAKPGLTGRVAVTFVIDRTGAVASARNGGSDLPGADVISCVVRAFSQLSFPQPEGGTVTVTYPILFSPAAKP